jgi:hypothetical protein
MLERTLRGQRNVRTGLAVLRSKCDVQGQIPTCCLVFGRRDAILVHILN